MPPICPSIASSGPAACFASAGIASTQAPDMRCATGSHRRCHVGMVRSIQSRAVHACVVRVPAGSDVTGSSHISARCTASVTALDWSEANPIVVVVEDSCWNAICFARS